MQDAGTPLAVATGRRRWERLLVLLAGLSAAVPVLVATVHAVRVGWVPAADQAIIATRAHDVFTSHMPLDGQYTTAWAVTGHVTRDLGPMLYWLVAVPSRFGSPASLTATMGVVNTLAVAGCVALARRRGGRVLMFGAAIAIALMCQSLAAETFHDDWNASAGVFPLTLLIFLCWSLACGDHRLLPVTVLVASFLVQTHLAYVAPVLALLTIGLAGLGLSRRRGVVRWALAALAVGCICWSLPVVDEIAHRPGNVTRVIQTATRDRSTLGPSVGWHAVVRAIGVPRPWWLYVPASRYDRKLDVRATPRPLSVGSSLAALGALASIALAGLRHRRRDLAAAALIGLLLCAALFADAAATPDVRVMAATLGYTMWWGSQVGMWVWLIPAWAAWLWVVPASRAVRRRLPAVRAAAAPAAASLLALVATVAVAAVVSAGERRDEHVALYRPIAALTASLDRRIPPARTLLLEGRLDLSGLPIKPALRYFLVRHGDRVLAPGSSRRLGSWYELDHHPYRYTIYVGDRITPPAMHFALADRVAYRDGWGRHVVTAWTSVLRRHGRRHPVPRGRRRSLSETSSRRPVTAGSRRSGRGGRRGSRG